MDLFIIAARSRALRQHWAEVRGDWESIDRFATEDGRRQEESFTPFRLDVVRNDCERWAERQMNEASRSRTGLLRLIDPVSRFFGPRRQPEVCGT